MVKDIRQNHYFNGWLLICCFMVALMIFIGGLTRLTNSGLSIVEWKPISGVIPPITNAEWEVEFAKYKTSPEYLKLNNNMVIEEFKFIFWLEFVHRFVGRLTGLVYFLPLLYFYGKGIIKQSRFVYLATLILFALQGFIGWYMVRSGLIDAPYVSHFRLALHLTTAFFIYHLLFQELLFNKIVIIVPNQPNPVIRMLLSLSIIILYLQVILGAFTAGLDAGLIYNSFPLMGTNFIASEIDLKFISLASFSDPVFIQFLHRMVAYLLAIVVVITIFQIFKTKSSNLYPIAYCMMVALLLQILLGILTLLYVVPTSIALLHQMGAIMLLSSLIWCYTVISKKN